MYKAILFQWDTQTSIWIKVRSYDVTKEVMEQKMKNARLLTNQDESTFFYKFDCLDEKEVNIGSILTLNCNLFI